MTTGTGPLLRSGNLKDYTPLGEEGNPVYKWATQIRVTIRRKISSESINVFAIPQPNENGDVIDWYAPESGSVIPWSSATREEKISAKEQLSSIQQQLNDTEEFNSSNNSEQSIFKRLLVHIIQFPDDEHVYLVNGKPVLTFWGFVNSDANIRPNPLAVLIIPELPKAVDAHAIQEGVVETLPVKRRFSWWWLLALLPLLLFLLLFFRGCGQVPGINTPGINTPEINTPGIERNRINDGAIIVPGDGIDSSLPSLEEDATNASNEESLSEGVEAEETKEPVEPESEESDPQAEESQAEEPQPEEPQPEEPETNQTEPEQADEVQPPTENPPLQPLAIPEQSDQQKSMDFLNGHWQADSGLMDKQGRPVKLEYDFKDGKGKVRIKKNDGTICSGTVEASMKGSELTFSDNEVIKCPNSKSYQPAKVKCKVDATNQTVCEGAYSGGENFKMNINKAKKTE